tara:strand:+ start:10727 stop:11038 length:312 start_codon:yes stop_codon:yes gene_type:complete
MRGKVNGDVAQLGEHYTCTVGVAGSSPAISTTINKGVLQMNIFNLVQNKTKCSHCLKIWDNDGTWNGKKIHTRNMYGFHMIEPTEAPDHKCVKDYYILGQQRK